MPAFEINWIKLLDDQTEDGVGVPQQLPFSGKYNLYTQGSFDSGATVLIEWSLDNVTYTAIKDCDGNALIITENSIETFLELNVGIYLRATLAGTSGGTDITSELRF